MKFSELKIGQEFDLGLDLDEYTPSFYKVSETDAYQTAGISSGTRETFDPDTEIYPDEVIRKLHDQPTEIEIAAMMLLKHAPITHTGLMVWTYALIENPNEMRNLDTFIDDDPKLVKDLTDEGFVRGDHFAGVYSAIVDCKPKGVYPTDPRENRWAHYDRAAAKLGFALECYRLAGRPEEGWDVSVWGMGGPLLKTVGNLATAIVQYHLEVVGAMRSYTNYLKTQISKQ